MITEQGTVVGVERDELIVEVLRTSACQSCNARQGCGQAVLSEWGDAKAQQKKNHFRIPYRQANANVGSIVELGMEPDTISKVAVLVYLLPLAIAFMGLLLGVGMGAPEGIQLVLFLLGLLFSYVLMSRLKLNLNAKLTPKILRVFPAHDASKRIPIQPLPLV